jgi:hypothetical protein
VYHCAWSIWENAAQTGPRTGTANGAQVGPITTATAFDSDPLEPSAAPEAERAAFGSVRRLVPSSGIQFLDLVIESTDLPMLRAWFTEDVIATADANRRVLIPLPQDASQDGTIWHPVTFRPLGPDETLSYTGIEGLEPFLDTWIPVPYLRFLGRSELGVARFDQGPANWARVYIATPAGGLRGRENLQAVLAFDTRLEPASRADDQPYLAPNLDDALFASTFLLADEPEQLADFLSQSWMDTWIKDCCSGLGPSADLFSHDSDLRDLKTSPQPPRFELAHVARYLTLLRVLKRAALLPQVRFIDSISATLPVPTSGVDLVIDFGAWETTALLVPSTQSQDVDGGLGEIGLTAIPLQLRDLSRPVDVHSGPIPSIVEFDHQTFGNAAASRRSGRPDAFSWTSLVRAGAEARRLALRANATDGLTGSSDLVSQLDNTGASDVLWRFSTAEGTANRAGPMVTGEMLRHLTETGDMSARNEALPPPGGRSAAPVVRPRFSQSSLVGFFVAELLLHAVSEINSAAPDAPFARTAGDDRGIRYLHRVVVTSAMSMPADARDLLVSRVHHAIDLVWRTQQWDTPGRIAQPAKPQIALGIGPDVGLQLVHLFDEVRTKFGGDFSDLVDCVRRRAGEPGARDSLRISSIDLGHRHSGITVIDYEIAHDGSVQAELVLADRFSIGSERVIEAIVERHLLAAIDHALAASGVGDPQGFLQSIISGGEGPGGELPAAFGKRFVTKILTPAASGIFEAYAALPKRGAEGLRRYRLDALVAAGGGALEPMAEQFDLAAASAGARGFSIGHVTFEIGRRQVQRLVEAELGPTLSAMSHAVSRSECDVLLMGGTLGGLPDLLDHILTLSPVPAGRIVVLGERSGASAAHLTKRIGGIQARAVLGAYMASRTGLKSGTFSIGTSHITRSLSSRRAETLAIGEDGGPTGSSPAERLIAPSPQRAALGGGRALPGALERTR